MGYFSQRKKHERVNFFLNVILAVMSALTLLAFFGNSDIRLVDLFGFWRFHYYIITLVVVVYALFRGFFIHAFLALLVLIVNYVAIASSANIFSNIASDGKGRLAVIYQNNVKQIEPLINEATNQNADIIGINHHLRSAFDSKTSEKYKAFYTKTGLENSFILTDKTPLRAGKLHLTTKRIASFLNFNENGHQFVFINVDFSGLDGQEEKIVYENLAEFILQQDEPVIVIGNFGIPAWSTTFKDFLNRTELEVKNRIIMSDGHKVFDLFTVPSFNVLAYRNVGLKKVKTLPAISGTHPFYFELNF